MRSRARWRPKHERCGVRAALISGGECKITGAARTNVNGYRAIPLAWNHKGAPEPLPAGLQEDLMQIKPRLAPSGPIGEKLPQPSLQEDI